MSKHEDEERLLELQIKVWGYSAKMKLIKDPDPDLIEDVTIEGHRGRVKKALRLLGDSGDITYTATHRTKGKKSVYGRPNDTYRIHNFDLSKVHAKKPLFKRSWWCFVDHSIKSTNDMDELHLIGYRDIYHMPNDEALYVYWHQDLFDFYNNHVYPKADMTTLHKAILRALVEEELFANFEKYAADFVGNEHSFFKSEDLYNISFRNFAIYPSYFYDVSFNGPNGFVEEYNKKLAEFQKVHEALMTFLRKVEEVGGFKEVMKGIRLKIMEALKRNSPIFMSNNQSDLKHYNVRFYTSSNQRTGGTGFSGPFFKFLMSHTDLFQYEVLYGDDVSIDEVVKPNQYSFTWTGNEPPTPRKNNGELEETS